MKTERGWIRALVLGGFILAGFAMRVLARDLDEKIMPEAWAKEKAAPGGYDEAVKKAGEAMADSNYEGAAEAYHLAGSLTPFAYVRARHLANEAWVCLVAGRAELGDWNKAKPNRKAAKGWLQKATQIIADAATLAGGIEEGLPAGTEKLHGIIIAQFKTDRKNISHWSDLKLSECGAD